MGIDLPDIDADGGDLAFLLGVLFNQQVRSEQAWQAPARLGERLGACDPFQLASTDSAELAEVIGQGPALHPWAATMARNVVGTCGVLVRDYEGRARDIWSDNPTGQALMMRLTSFPGIGQHKARVAIALLILEYRRAIGGDAAALTAQALASCPRLAEIVLPPRTAAETERTNDVASHGPLRRSGSVLQSSRRRPDRQLSCGDGPAVKPDLPINP
jgi:uncharacterized HhH-GPD family protein